MKHYQTVDPLQKESQVGRGLFGIRVLILHFKFQFSKSVKSSTFHIFLNLTYPLRKNLSFPKHLKITQKFTQNCQTVDNVLSIGIWRRLKRDRDIGRKAVLSDVKTDFTFTPALITARARKNKRTARMLANARKDHSIPLLCLLCTSVHYKPTDSHSCLLYSSSHPSHVKNSIPYSDQYQFLGNCAPTPPLTQQNTNLFTYYNMLG